MKRRQPHMLDGRPTGAKLFDELWREAQRRHQHIYAMVEPLTPSPHKFLSQLREAKTPKPHTVERVRALIAGDPVPPPPLNNFQLGLAAAGQTPSEAARASAAVREKRAIEARRELYYRATERRLPGESMADAVSRLARAA